MNRWFRWGFLPLLLLVLGANASHAGTLPNCTSSSCYYRVQEGLVYQGQTLIHFGTAQQVAMLAHPVVLTVHVGQAAYRFVYKIADTIITKSGQKGVRSTSELANTWETGGQLSVNPAWSF